MNTIHQQGTILSLEEKKKLRSRANSMENQIRSFFRSTPRGYTAEDIHAALFPFGLLTSVRRSLSNLLNEEFLIKETDDKKRKGSRGVFLHTYRIKTDQDI